MSRRDYLLKHLHLIISLLVVVPVAFAYGVNPNGILSIYFDFTVETTDLNNIFRAIMGLYLGLSALWLLGLKNGKYWFAATISNMLFMGGLALGRLLSFFLDDLPSLPFVIGLIGEAVVAAYALLQLLKYFKK